MIEHESATTADGIKSNFWTNYFPDNPRRAFTFIAVLYLFAALLLTYYFILSYPLEITANLLFDDAYYYLGVAQNIADGKGSSFGGLVKTNGYHPLWLILLATVIYLFSFQKILAFAAVPTLIFLVKSFSLFKLSTLKSIQATPLLLAAAVVIMMYPGIFSQGLETCLLLLCLPLLSQLKEFPAYFSIKTCAKYSAIFIFLFLIRLDFLAIMAAFSLLSFLSIVKGRQGVAQNLALTILLTTAALSIYFFVNYRMFGVIVPISGLSKAVGLKPGENSGILLQYLIFSRFAMIALALNFMLTKNAGEKSIDKHVFSNELRLAIIAAAIVAAYYAFFSGWPLWNWYYWPVALVTLYAIATLFYSSVLARKQYGRNIGSKAVLFASWIFLAYVSLLAVKTEISTGIFKTLVMLQSGKEVKPNYTAMNIRLINDFFMKAPDGIVAMGDRAGGLGFWLPERFKFFHTEGLVANKEYMVARKAGTGADFLKKLGIKYFIVERERLFEAHSSDGTALHGIVEPIQGLSAHSGLVLVCLPVDAILFTQRYGEQTRHVYDFTKTSDCPEEIDAKVEALSKNYGELRKYSLPSEYREANWFKKYVLNPS